MQTIHIESLLLQETGTYNPQFLRPYTTHVDGQLLNTLSERIDMHYNPVGKQSHTSRLSGALFSGVSGQLLQPRSQVGRVVDIPQGWSERRLRFIMVVVATISTGAEMRYYLQGFTSHLGVIQNSLAMGTGSLDPNMEFYVNSIIGTITTFANTPFGLVPTTRVIESSQVINGVMHNTMAPVLAMRPIDVYADIQRHHLMTGMNAYSTSPVDIMDTRLNESMETQRSKRSSNLAGSYLGDFVRAQKTSQLASQMLDGPNDQLGACRETVMEPSIVENPFFLALRNIQGVHNASKFTSSDLAKIDPTMGSRVEYRKITNVQLAGLHQTGVTEHWNGADLTTIAAFTLVNGLSSIMLDLFITNISFTASNMVSLDGSVVTTIESANSFIQNVDMRGHYAALIERLNREVLANISQDNMIGFTIKVNADLFLETWVTITLAGVSNPETVYVLPSFCDATLAPVLADSVDHRENFSYEMEKIFNHLNGAISSNNQIIQGL